MRPQHYRNRRSHLRAWPGFPPLLCGQCRRRIDPGNLIWPYPGRDLLWAHTDCRAAAARHAARQVPAIDRHPA